MDNSLEYKAIEYLRNLNAEVYEKEYVLKKLMQVFSFDREASNIIYNNWRKEYINLRVVSKEEMDKFYKQKKMREERFSKGLSILTEEEKKEVLRLRSRGKTFSYIADYFCVSATVIQKVVRESKL